jgi:hypothetical protein
VVRISAGYDRPVRWILGLTLIGCGLALSFDRSASAQRSRYCEKPNQSGAFLIASPGVTCATAEIVKDRLTSPGCYQRARCVVEGFRCVAFWDGRFDRPFMYTHHALCSSGWRWIEWDGS